MEMSVHKAEKNRTDDDGDPTNKIDEGGGKSGTDDGCV